MLLSREIFKFGDPGIIVIIRIIHDCDGLKLPDSGKMLMLELQRPVWQLAESIIEISIDGSGKNGVSRSHLPSNRKKIYADLDAYPPMIEHALEHPGKPMQRHVLKCVGEVTIIMIGARRNARDHAGGEFRRIEAPLLARISAEELFV